MGVERDGIFFMRAPISLPCSVPVVPGTSDTDAPIEERTEVCAVDAFYMMELAMICDHHGLGLFGVEEWGQIIEGLGGPMLYDGEPWAERHRYDQEFARGTLFPGHPLATS